MKNSFKINSDYHLSSPSSIFSENSKGDEEMIILINTLNSQIKTFYKSMKNQISIGKNNNNDIQSILKNYDNMNEILNQFIYNAKDSFQNLKMTRRRKILEEELHSYSNNHKKISPKINYTNKLKKYYLTLNSPQRENSNLSPRLLDDFNNIKNFQNKLFHNNDYNLPHNVLYLFEEIFQILNELNIFKGKIVHESIEIIDERKRIFNIIDNLFKKMNNFLEKNKKTLKKNKSKSIQFDELKNPNNDIQNQLKEKIDLIEKLNEEIIIKNNIIDKYKTRITNLKNLNDKKIKENNEYKKKYDEIVKLLNTKEEYLKKNTNEENLKKNISEKKISKLNLEIIKLNNELKIQKNYLNEFNKKINEKDKIISQLQNENSRLTSDIAKNIIEKNNFIQEIDKIKINNENHLNIFNLQKDLETKNKLIDTLNENINNLNNQINELNLKNINLSNTIEKLNDELFSLKNKDINEEFNKLKEENKNFKTQLTKLTNISNNNLINNNIKINNLKEQIEIIKKEKENLINYITEEIKIYEDNNNKIQNEIKIKIIDFENNKKNEINKISNLHKKEINQITIKHKNEIINLENTINNLKKQNETLIQQGNERKILNIVSPEKYNIIIDKHINISNNENLHWYLITEKDSKNKNYFNTFWINESEINNLSKYNKFKTEDELEKDNIEKIMKMQQKFIQEIQKKDDEIDDLKSENKKKEILLSNSSDLKNNNKKKNIENNIYSSQIDKKKKPKNFDSLSDKLFPYKKYKKELSELNAKLEKSTNYILQLKSQREGKFGFNDELSFIKNDEKNKSGFFDDEIKEVIEFENGEMLNTKNQLEYKMIQLKSLFKLLIYEIPLSNKLKNTVKEICELLAFNNEDIEKMLKDKEKNHKIFGFLKKK